MCAKEVALDHVRILNYCAKHLARDKGNIQEAWRFPIIENAYPSASSKNHNIVSFVFAHSEATNIQVFLSGTFAPLHQRLPLQVIRFNQQSTRFHAASFLIPHGELHRYRFYIDGNWTTDPINPQTQTQDNGESWSQFFTDYCCTPILFNEPQRMLLRRLTQHLLPFCSEAGKRFLNRHYQHLDDTRKRQPQEKVYQLDSSVGETNYIDKLLCREERHHLTNYQQGLTNIDFVLRKRNPFEQPHALSKQFFFDLYQDMVDDHVIGWPDDSPTRPRQFLQILRRHTIMAMFSHPKYGGNVTAAGWEFLRDHFSSTDFDAFNWSLAAEEPLGHNKEYLG